MLRLARAAHTEEAAPSPLTDRQRCRHPCHRGAKGHDQASAMPADLQGWEVTLPLASRQRRRYTLFSVAPFGAGVHNPAGAPPGNLQGLQVRAQRRPLTGWRRRRYPLFTVAPEGTTKPARCLLTFSTGAFVAGAPVLPVLFQYRFRQASG